MSNSCWFALIVEGGGSFTSAAQLIVPEFGTILAITRNKINDRKMTENP
jgi:hypothetical protein